VNFGVRKLESWGYCATLFAWSYVYPFWYNTRLIVCHYLCDPVFSHFDTIPQCYWHTHTQTDGHTTTAYTTLSI